MRLFGILKVLARQESGLTLMETVVALAVLGTIAVCFLSGLVASSKAAFTVDEQATAMSLAQSIMEWAENATYSSTGYSPAPTPPSGKDYVNYTANITAVPLHVGDEDIQKITVTVNRSGEQVFTLESYKVKHQ